MAINYAAMVDLATRLIGENGRAVTLKRQSQTLADPTRPWGPSVADAETEIPATMVFLDPEIRQTTSGDIQPTAQIDNFRRLRALLAASTADLPDELGTDWYIDDGGKRLEIVISKPVKPGGVTIYYDIEVRA